MFFYGVIVGLIVAILLWGRVPAVAAILLALVLPFFTAILIWWLGAVAVCASPILLALFIARDNRKVDAEALVDHS
ncbi:MAG: hypothetical protein ACI8XO_004592 [Verrucomicrobiales bacterium]|jgi:uncharacterized protein YacL